MTKRTGDMKVGKVTWHVGETPVKAVRLEDLDENMQAWIRHGPDMRDMLAALSRRVHMPDVDELLDKVPPPEED